MLAAVKLLAALRLCSRDAHGELLAMCDAMAYWICRLLLALHMMQLVSITTSLTNVKCTKMLFDSSIYHGQRLSGSDVPCRVLIGCNHQHNCWTDRGKHDEARVRTVYQDTAAGVVRCAGGKDVPLPAAILPLLADRAPGCWPAMWLGGGMLPDCEECCVASICFIPSVGRPLHS